MERALNFEVTVPREIAYVQDLAPDEFTRRLEQGDRDVKVFTNMMKEGALQFLTHQEKNKPIVSEFLHCCHTQLYLTREIANLKQRIAKSTRNSKKAKMNLRLKEAEEELAKAEAKKTKLKPKMNIAIDDTHKWIATTAGAGGQKDGSGSDVIVENLAKEEEAE